MVCTTKDLYKSIDITPECSIVTENNIHYNFKNLDEVLQYDFSDKIKQIEIKNKEYSNTKKLRIIFEIQTFYAPFFFFLLLLSGESSDRL